MRFLAAPLRVTAAEAVGLILIPNEERRPVSVVALRSDVMDQVGQRCPAPVPGDVGRDATVWDGGAVDHAKEPGESWA